jgi:hypothetical protein
VKPLLRIHDCMHWRDPSDSGERSPQRDGDDNASIHTGLELMLLPLARLENLWLPGNQEKSTERAYQDSGK